jgi:formate hydrogenlyase subunit 3/multisubunit Na+/H+ antiporter MnhD subunit
MTLPPVIPIVFLCLGSLAVGASHLTRLRLPSLVMALATLAALLAALTLRPGLPVTQIVADWQPVSVFAVPLSFRVDQTAWVLSVGLLLVCLATALTWLAHPGQHRPGPRAVSLLLVAAAIASLYASNLLMLVIAWGMMDIMLVVALLVRSDPQLGRRAAAAIILYTSSTLSVWIATLLIENEHGSLYWRLLDPGHSAQSWLILAAALRIGLYPFHQWLPTELGQSPDRATLLVTVPPTAGLALLARLALAQALPLDSIVPALAAISALVGSALAFRRPQRRAGLPFIALAVAGLATAALVTDSAGVLTAAALNWMFVIVSLFIARGFTRQQWWWSAGMLIAAAAVAGVPGTLGFAVRTSLLDRLLTDNHWALLMIVLMAETLLIAAIVRPLFRPSAEEEPIGRARAASFAAAMACAALPLVIFGLISGLIPGLPPLSQVAGRWSVTLILALMLPVAAGVTLGWRFRSTGVAGDDTHEAVWERLVRLEWLNALAAALMQRLTALLRGLSNVIEGEGGLVWAIVIIVVGLVLSTGALR